MATKLAKREVPAGLTPADFAYQGRPAKDMGDFGDDVGLADAACVDQFGEANTAKQYHCGVVKSSDGRWFMYTEWGRCKAGNSWSGTSWTGCSQEFMFVACSGETEARKEFRTKINSKTIKRCEQRTIGSKTLWVSKPGEDGYLVMKLATRDKGLPDAYKIKDNGGVTPTTAAKPAPQAKAATVMTSTRTFHPEVVKLAMALVGGVKSYTRALAAATGVTPTMAAINEVRDDLIPIAMERLKVVGTDIAAQCRDSDLRAISKTVAALIPRPIPRTGITDEQAILNAGNIFVLQQDLDTFEAALRNESFDAESNSAPQTDPDLLLNARLTWMDTRNGEGQAIAQALLRMTNHRHAYLSGSMRVLNLFRVERPDRDAQFMKCVESVAAARKGRFSVRANLQPATRTDLTDKEMTLYRAANVIFTQHGTRSVNIHPIISTHFRLPRQLSGVPIAGANFGHGSYSSVDYKKASGYTSYERSAWGGGGGAIRGRGAFMFLLDTLMGEAYVAPSTGSWTQPPNGCDSVFGRGGDRGHRLENDEHVVFTPSYNRIRYLVEFTF